jgi:hypothetical protein
VVCKLSAVKESEELELAYGDYTDRFRIIAALNMGAAFMKYYDPNNLDPVIGAMWRLHTLFENTYQSISARFYESYRQNETGTLTPVPFAQNKNTYSSVVTSFMIHGPQAIKKKQDVLGVDWEDFTDFQKQQSLSHVAGEMVYKALEAPRANMMETISADPDVSRWIRKVNSGACDFCRMVASRGPVFSSKTAKFSAHRDCGCSAIPVFKNYRIPKEDELAAQRWMDKNKGAETKARRAANNESDVKNGYKEKNVEPYVDKYGRLGTRTTYVDTEKGKQAKLEAAKKAQETLDGLKRDGKDYVKHDLSPKTQKDIDTYRNKVLADLKSNPVKSMELSLV